MLKVKDLPITGKLTYVVMLTCATILLLASCIYVTSEFVTYRRDMVDKLTMLADVIGENSKAAVTFEDADSAEKVLAALRADPAVISGSIHTAGGALFARYRGSRYGEHPLVYDAGPELREQPAYRFRSDYLAIIAPIVLDGELIGFVRIESSLAPLYIRLRWSLALASAILLAAFTLAYLLSSRLQKLISAPILRLTDAMQRVTEEQDYTLRAAKSGEDEIGVLIDGFNEMLDEIRQRDERLGHHRRQLEHQVAERTVDLSRANEELKTAFADARRAQVAAEAASQAKSEFLARMSHEIRTPINGVMGMAELLLNTELSDRQRRFAEAVNLSGEALLGVINDILDFSKIEAGKLELQQQPFDLRALIEDLGELFAERAQSKALELVCAVPADVPTALVGDAARLNQILTNLVGNAIKFTEQGEVVVMVVEVEDLVADDGAAAGVMVRFEVCDTGSGIAPDDQARVFESFSQVDGSSTRRYGGSGLGLAIAQQLVALMGGAIGVRSAPGEGSTFWFTARLEKMPLPLSTEPADATVLDGVRVLVIDDNETNREILFHQLAFWGMVCDAVADGPQGLDSLHSAVRQGQPYRLALLDRHMPGMDGLELARAVKAQAAIADIRLVMLSSVAGDDGADALQQAGIAAYLTKPVRQLPLRDCLLATLDAAPAPEPSGEGAAAPAANGDVAGRILVAEDNPVNLEVTLSMLEICGYRADGVADGRAAVEAVARVAYDLVLMDCQMPELDGFGATREIRRREQPAGRHTPVVALTANALAGDRALCLAAGMDDYISKPFTREQLREVLAQWLPCSDTVDP